jgi:hypothetical protein
MEERVIDPRSLRLSRLFGGAVSASHPGQFTSGG